MGMIKFKGHYQVELPALQSLNHVLSVVRVSSRHVPHQFPVKSLTLRTFMSGGDSPMSWEILVWISSGVAVVRTSRVAWSAQAKRVVVSCKVIWLTDWPCREFSPVDGSCVVNRLWRFLIWLLWSTCWRLSVGLWRFHPSKIEWVLLERL